MKCCFCGSELMRKPNNEKFFCINKACVTNRDYLSVDWEHSIDAEKARRALKVAFDTLNEVIYSNVDWYSQELCRGAIFRIKQILGISTKEDKQ